MCFFFLELFFFTTCLVDTRQAASYVAKCHLGKVKIKPMLVVDCVCWGQRITRKLHVTLCGVVARAWHLPSLGLHFACVFANCGI